MRLGKEQAAGFVEDIEEPVQTEVKISDPERALAAVEPEPAAAGG